MKTKSCDREAVALLACAALSAGEAMTVQGHLRACPACSEYFQEMTAVCATHARAARHLSEAEAPAARYRPIASALPRASRSGWGMPQGFFGVFRILAAATTAILVLFSAWTLFHRPGPVLPQVAHTPPLAPAVKLAPTSSSPKLMTYRLALNGSLDEFEGLVAHEAARPTAGATTAFHPGAAWVDLEL